LTANGFDALQVFNTRSSGDILFFDNITLTPAPGSLAAFAPLALAGATHRRR